MKHYSPPLSHPKTVWWLCFLLLLTSLPLKASFTDFADHPNLAFTCNTNLQVALAPDNCEALVTPYDILEGETAGCCDLYTVELFYDPAFTNPVPTSPTLTSAEIGLSIYVIVTNPADGNNCDNAILSVVDQVVPDLTCGAMVQIDCTDPLTPGTGPLDFPVPGSATVVGNSQPYVVLNFDPCGPATLTYVDDEIDGVCGTDPFLRQITRTWTVEDASGNTKSCDQTIEINRSTLADVDFPLNRDGMAAPFLVCNDLDDDSINDNVDPNVLLDSNGNPSPEVTGFPTINGNPITDPLACDLAYDYTDNIQDLCDGSYLILREWVVTVWCPTTAVATQVQVIKVMDNIAPVITCPADLTVSTGQNDCTASVILPIPTITDECSTTTTYDISFTQGTLLNNTLFNLPLGITTVTYTAEDPCGNIATCSFDIIVEDQVPPVPICETFRVVSLTTNDPTLANAEVFDDGSTDNCGNISFAARRLDNPNCPGFDGTAFGPTVPFFCCDIGVDANGDPLTVMVELLVTDDAGNTNSCTVAVEVQDQLNPAITCPTDKVLDCGADTSPSSTGTALATDNCNATVSFSDSGTLDDCGEGTIFRTWTATDDGGRTASCVQRIDVINSNPFTVTDTECRNFPLGVEHSLSDGVEWPCDVSLSTCGAGLSPDDLENTVGVDPLDARPQLFFGDCDDIIPIFTDDTLPIQLPSCLKILRLWEIFDWCSSTPTVPVGSYVQVITVMNSSAPVITSDCTGQIYGSFDPNCVEGTAELFFSATDDCTPDDELSYSYEIDEFDDTTVDASGNTNDATGNYPLGTHRITWEVEDGCNNVTTCSYTFSIVDSLPPTPIAFSGLSTDINPGTNSVTLSAGFFENASTDNCGVAEFRIAYPSGGPNQTTPPLTTTITFVCADLGMQAVDFWVGDINGNWDYVTVMIDVQNNMGACLEPNYAIVSGAVQNEDGAEVSQVQVMLTGGGMDDENMTGNDGNYEFYLPIEQNYTVAPERNDDAVNGVSTFDLLLITQHILQIEQLGSPYKMIAADVNQSGSISGLDIVDLRKVILFIEQEFPNSNSWRFVAADYVFPLSEDPFANTFPEVFAVNQLTEDEVADFIAIKVGDVNCSAAPTGLQEDSADQFEETKAWTLQVSDQQLVAGETYLVGFKAATANTQGFQFTFHFDTELLEFAGLEKGILPEFGEHNFGWQMQREGVLTCSWHSPNGAAQRVADEALFSLRFVAKQTGQLRKAIHIDSHYTRAEAYLNNDIRPIALEFDATPVAVTRLHQNRPNPFKAETVVSYDLAAAGPVIIRLYDLSGRVLATIERDAAAGYNELTIPAAQLGGPGLYYYELEADGERHLGKMILME